MTRNLVCYVYTPDYAHEGCGREEYFSARYKPNTANEFYSAIGGGQRPLYTPHYDLHLAVEIFRKFRIYD